MTPSLFLGGWGLMMITSHFYVQKVVKKFPVCSSEVSDLGAGVRSKISRFLMTSFANSPQPNN